MLHVFGAAHSSLIVAELFYRAGGLAPVNPITDPKLACLREHGTMKIGG